MGEKWQKMEEKMDSWMRRDMEEDLETSDMLI